jgi:Tol biopolymer transport system component
MKYARIVPVLLVLFCNCSKDADRPRLIVFQSSRDSNFEIYVMNMDGTGQRRITNSPSNDISPSLSPDDTTILFASDRSGNWEIYSVRSNGGEPKALTTGQGSNSAPSWALGGTKILFVSTRDAINGELYLMKPDGTGIQRLTQDGLVKDTPVMTADGHTVLMTVTDHGRRGIASVDVSRGQLRLLTSLDHNSMDPAPSPDGTTIAFASDREGRFQIYTMTLEGKNLRRLRADADENVQPWWLPRQSMMLFVRHGQICRYSIDEEKDTLLSFKGDSTPRCAIP